MLFRMRFFLALTLLRCPSGLARGVCRRCTDAGLAASRCGAQKASGARSAGRRGGRGRDVPRRCTWPTFGPRLKPPGVALLSHSRALKARGPVALARVGGVDGSRRSRAVGGPLASPGCGESEAPCCEAPHVCLAARSRVERQVEPVPYLSPCDARPTAEHRSRPSRTLRPPRDCEAGSLRIGRPPVGGSGSASSPSRTSLRLSSGARST